MLAAATVIPPFENMYEFTTCYFLSWHNLLSPFVFFNFL
jgi:hypothetical protein